MTLLTCSQVHRPHPRLQGVISGSWISLRRRSNTVETVDVSEYPRDPIDKLAKLSIEMPVRRIHDVEWVLRARPVFQNGNETATVDMGLRDNTEGLADA